MNTALDITSGAVFMGSGLSRVALGRNDEAGEAGCRP